MDKKTNPKHANTSGDGSDGDGDGDSHSDDEDDTELRNSIAALAREAPSDSDSDGEAVASSSTNTQAKQHRAVLSKEGHEGAKQPVKRSKPDKVTAAPKKDSSKPSSKMASLDGTSSGSYANDSFILEEVVDGVDDGDASEEIALSSSSHHQPSYGRHGSHDSGRGRGGRGGAGASRLSDRSRFSSGSGSRAGGAGGLHKQDARLLRWQQGSRGGKGKSLPTRGENFPRDNTTHHQSQSSSSYDHKKKFDKNGDQRSRKKSGDAKKPQAPFVADWQSNKAGVSAMNSSEMTKKKHTGQILEAAGKKMKFDWEYFPQYVPDGVETYMMILIIICIVFSLAIYFLVVLI